MSDSLRHHGLQHARPPCPSPTPGVYPNSCPLSRWCHPTISSSVVPLSSHLQSFPASGSFQWVIYLIWAYLNLIPSLKHSHTKTQSSERFTCGIPQTLKKEMTPIWEKPLLENMEGSYQVQPISDITEWWKRSKILKETGREKERKWEKITHNQLGFIQKVQDWVILWKSINEI